jgi:hypothetical protein
MSETPILAAHESKNAREFLERAIIAGAGVAWLPGVDSGGNPYVTIRATKHLKYELRLTWHTRETGTWRLFSALVRTINSPQMHEITLKAAYKILEEID